jgi:hypothetical protein
MPAEVAQRLRSGPFGRVFTAAAGPFILVVVLAGMVSVLLTVGTGNGSAFAGYVWGGPVVAVRGSWAVPRILARSAPGIASTWIAAQAPGGANAPFIQIGTNEQRVGSTPPAGSPSLPYFAFWSDTARHFHPVGLFPVNAGDELSASLTLGRGKWTLAIVDHSTGQSANLTTTNEADGSFNQAEWTQEDVTNGITNAPFPYPRLSSFAFHDLSVNSSVPNSVSLSPQTLSEHGVTVTPSAVDDDSFTLTEH